MLGGPLTLHPLLALMGSANNQYGHLKFHPALAILTSIAIVGLAVLTIIVVATFFRPV